MSERLEIDPDELRDHDATARPRRRLFPAVLLTAAVAGVGYFSWWTYQHAKPPVIPSNVPVIHSDAGPVKQVPTNPGGMVVPDQDSALLNRSGAGTPRVEQLLPAPEQALPRPVAPPKPVPVPQETTDATAKLAAPAEAPAIPAKPAPQPDIAAAPALPAAPIAAVPSTPSPAIAAPAVAPAPAIASAAPPPAVAIAPPAAHPAAGYRLQLGALRSEDAAKQEWLHLQKAQPDILGKLGVSIVRADLGDKGVFYRIQAGPVGDAGEATQSCASLKSRNIGCILVKP